MCPSLDLIQRTQHWWVPYRLQSFSIARRAQGVCYTGRASARRIGFSSFPCHIEKTWSCMPLLARPSLKLAEARGNHSNCVSRKLSRKQTAWNRLGRVSFLKINYIIKVYFSHKSIRHQGITTYGLSSAIKVTGLLVVLVVFSMLSKDTANNLLTVVPARTPRPWHEAPGAKVHRIVS